MGLTSHNLKYIIKLIKQYGIQGPILTFGNQDCYATIENASHWIQQAGLEIKPTKQIFYSTSQSLTKINKEASKYIHAKTFFEMMGIPVSEYFDIDKFDFDNPAICHDLEQPVPEKYHNYFNFILDSGTLEHIFDIKSVMSNIVQMTKVDGYVLQVIPAQNFLNHGFYQLSPTFFHDFYSANGFEITESYIVEIRGNTHRFHSYNHEEDYLSLFFPPSSRLVNCFLAKKVKSTERIISPSQSIYQKLAENSDAVDEDWNKTRFDKLVSTIRGIVPIRFHGMFFNLWSLLKRITTKRDYFDIKQ